ncbi:MAG: restriction endonuclease subunit S [Gammaproteobacteria bacterium]|nr:restriction endonuclease subunit S [Gammaproteobacteria bacterium]
MFKKSPQHWEFRRLRHIGTLQNGVSKRAEYFGSGYPFISYGDVYNNMALPSILNGLAMSSDSDRNHFSVEEGDIFFTRTSEIAEEIGVSSVCLKTIKNTVFSGFLIRFRPNKKIPMPDFSKYYFRSDIPCYFFIKEMNLVTRVSLSQNILKNFPILIPPMATQKKIAKFLDCEIGRIDQLIEQKKAFLLQASKRIESLVDKAISCNDVFSIRFENVVQRMQRTVNLSEHDELVRLGLYNRGRGIFKKPSTDVEEIGDSKFFFVETGDLILSGQFAWEGAVALATSKEEGCVVSHRYPIYRGKKNVNTEYLFGLFRSDFGDFILNEASRGSAGRNRPLNTWRLGKEKIPIPGVPLQKEVEKAVIFERHLREKMQRSIDILEEFRSSLITEAVTGQLDVNAWGKRGKTNKCLDQIEETMTS